MTHPHGGHSQTIFPIPNAALVDERGRITPPWYRLIVTLSQRTGGTGGRNTPEELDSLQLGLFDFSSAQRGNDAPIWFGLDFGSDTSQTVLMDFSKPNSIPPALFPFLPDEPAPAAPEAITVGASPFLFSPGFDGFVIVSGGTISSIQISRDGGATLYPTGLTTGSFPLALSDSIQITYTVLPTVTFFRR